MQLSAGAMPKWIVVDPSGGSPLDVWGLISNMNGSIVKDTPSVWRNRDDVRVWWFCLWMLHRFCSIP
ncbi:uncharacterized protein P174DRAFT_214007 [Aspergillus novofumigatus IBT 16806]|uniref:Uncharacterized protein n=1 Tax=Aspergillus novofumigatus (strain IBT 16806) TaxID=1392255 RepID=A0A2I1C5C5_ASPN1|nr:uncharacterized protein P174DRAFT_214007 [Aspergillus novofumigatus IBT 16806]PKX92807.1 hypothetical protein P174DRAFT_214007 [Aspergillus novofumigatus IBT 16806]